MSTESTRSARSAESTRSARSAESTAPVTQSRSLLRTLVAEESISLLQRGGVGRVAVVVAGAPHILPVNYVAYDDVVVFRTAPGTLLNEVSLREVAFEVDGVDLRTKSGWSVCVHGRGHDITDAVDADSRRLRELAIDCWAPGERDRFYKILPRQITGRQLHPGRVSASPAEPLMTARA